MGGDTVTESTRTKTILKSELEEDSVLAETLTNKAGGTIISKNTKLTKAHINRLQKFMDDIKKVKIYKKQSEIENEIQRKKNDKRINLLKKIYEDYKDNDTVGNKCFKSAYEKILDVSHLNKSEILLNIHQISKISKEEYLFGHAINTGLLVRLSSDWFNLSKEEEKYLALACLLHDIGKVKMFNTNFIDNKEPDTEGRMKVYRQHPVFAYQYLKDNVFASETTLEAVLLHHENNDGTGYPFGLNKDKLSFTTRLFAVINTFDKLAFKIGNDGIRSPLNALEELRNLGMKNKLDIPLVLKFIDNIIEYYIGCQVILDNNKKGKIVAVDENYPKTPVIYLKNSREIDLRTEDVHVKSTKIE
jgi:HD-GYP domain-containing protein (c-di-GMP phosphodiesterase class II)